MTNLKLLKLTSKSNGEPFEFFQHLTWGHLRNPDGTTCLISNGGACVHVKEAPDKVAKLLAGTKTTKEKTNDRN